jgi:hypothetical protein
MSPVQSAVERWAHSSGCTHVVPCGKMPFAHVADHGVELNEHCVLRRVSATCPAPQAIAHLHRRVPQHFTQRGTLSSAKNEHVSRVGVG